MKRGLIFHYSILLMICQVLMGIFGGFEAFAANTDNFHFKSFEADYYLSRDVDGVSKLRVVENLTAVFPDYRQNKGICREIPFTNQDGANVTLSELTRADVKLMRNGVKEPIYSITKYSDFYEVCAGDEEYVLGEQEYTFEYEFERVVTEFPGYQELYWDTNGNGWSQKFESVTARVHFSEEILDDFSGKSWCYVGKYRDGGSERCQIAKIADGIQFQATDLKARENLTFDVEIQAGTFVVPESEKNYFLMIVLGLAIGICLFCLISPIRKFLATRKKARYYNGFFVKPEYQPHATYSLAEMVEIYIGKKKDVKVGVILEMIIKGRIQLLKRQSQIFKSEKWAIYIRDLKGAKVEELVVLAILNGGDEVEEGDTITLRARAGDSMMWRLVRKFDSTVLADLKKDGLVEAKYKIGSSSGANVGLIVWLVFVLPFVISMAGVFSVAIRDMGLVGGKMVGEEFFGVAFLGVIAATIIVRAILKNKTKKFAGHTLKGLEAARYMDGLRLYIKMAEAERLKFLQSVSGAEVTPEGVVKLNEKLLPYAAIFGLEKSWAEELEQYYRVHGAEAPDWYQGNYSIMDVVITSRLAASYVRSSTVVSSSGRSISGGGGSSSSFSGGGGGGFSGGGGGGGGGGGR